MNAGDALFSEPDAATGAPGQQIVYAADASVFYFYINTFAAREYNKVEALPQLIRRAAERGERSRGGHGGVARAAITAEFIFSPYPSGKAGFPVYVDDAHAAEFSGRISEIYAGLRDEGMPQMDQATERRLHRRARELARRLEKAGQLAASDPLARDRALSELRQLLDEKIPALIREFDLEKLDRALHILHLMGGDVIRPLRLAPGIDRNLLRQEPDIDSVARWLELLEDFMPEEIDLAIGSGGSREPTEGPDRSRNRKADAKVLARFEALNDDLRARGLDTRVVLITTSPSMLSANNFWLKNNDYGIERSLLRSLTQFVPVLNFRDMPNFAERERAGLHLRNACQGLFQWNRDFDREQEARVLMSFEIYMRELNRRTARSMRNSRERQSTRLERALAETLRIGNINSVLQWADRENFDRRLDEIAKTWRKLMENSIGLNAPLLAKRYGKHLGQISQELETLRAQEFAAALGASYEDAQVSLADRLARLHLQMAARLMIGEIDRRAELHAMVPDASRLGKFMPETARTAGRRFVAAVAAADHAGAEKALIELTSDRQVPVVEQTLSVATVAFRIGLWQSAANFASQAEKLATDCAEWRGAPSHSACLRGEAFWLMGVAERASIAARSAVGDGWRKSVTAKLDRAKRFQIDAIDQFDKAGDHVGKARSRAELA